MGLRQICGSAVVAVSMLTGGAAILPSAQAQAADTEIPILTSVSRIGPASADAPTTMKIAYTSTDASDTVTATAVITDPRGNWLFASATGKNGVLELPLGIHSLAGKYYVSHIGLRDSADPANAGTYSLNGGVTKGPESTGPTTHTIDLSAADFTRTGTPPWGTLPLRPLTEGQPTFVYDISPTGTSVGSSGTAPQTTPVKWNFAGGPTNLPVPPGCSGAATSISDNGTIAGQLTCASAPTSRTMVWFPNGTTQGVPDGVLTEDVDNLGITVGSVDGHAVAVVQGQTLKHLEDSTADSSTARALTNYGYVVGDVSDLPGAGNAQQIAVGWSGDHVFPLWDTSVESSAVDVNHLGYALVQIKTAGATRGVLVGANNSVILLDDAGDTDEVLDVNYHGLVLGVRTVGEERMGVIYYGPTTVVRLDSIVTAEDKAIWGFQDPVAIDDRGRVVGNSDGGAWILQAPAF